MLSWRRIVPIAAALVGMAITGALGQWQVSRGLEKRALEHTMHQRTEMPVLDGLMLVHGIAPEQLPDLLHRRMELQGEWLPDYTVFLDNRVMDNQTGFYVVTPLQLRGSDRVVVVLRGWAARDFHDRMRLPEVDTPPGPVRVVGLLSDYLPENFALGEDFGGQIRQNLHLDEYRIETGLPLSNVLVRQIGEPSEGLARRWPPPPVRVERHYGYAVQWYGLCALFGLLLVWFQIVQPLRARRRAHG